MIYFLYSPYSQSLINNTGIPSPQITFEKIEFHNNQIIASIRNTGSTEIIISQADVNDRIQAAAIEPSKILQRLSEAKVIIPFLWNSGEPYEIGITTSDGVRFSKTIQAAAATPIPDASSIICICNSRKLCWSDPYNDRACMVSFYEKTKYKSIQFFLESHCRIACIFRY